MYTRSDLLKPKPLSVDTMSFRLKILNNYYNNLSSPDNKSFPEAEMIEIVLSMISAVWINSMITAGLEHMEKAYEGFIEHLENIESSLPDGPILKKDKHKDASPKSTSSLKED